MIPATQTIHLAHFSALTTGTGGTAMTALGVAASKVFDGLADSGTAPPYVVYTDESETEPGGRRSDRARATEVVITTVCWADEPKDAKEIARKVGELCVSYDFSLSGLTDAVTIDCNLEMFGPPFTDGEEPRTWGCPVAVRYLIYQAA